MVRCYNADKPIKHQEKIIPTNFKNDLPNNCEYKRDQYGDLCGYVPASPDNSIVPLFSSKKVENLPISRTYFFNAAILPNQSMMSRANRTFIGFFFPKSDCVTTSNGVETIKEGYQCKSIVFVS